MTVRDATCGDAGAIRSVAVAAWRDTYAGLLAETTIEAFTAAAYSIERLERRIERHTFLVVEDRGQIIGFADAVAETDRLNLGAIYVAPDRRGGGAGTILLREARSRHPELPVTADVLVGNRKGEVFYERRGFVPNETLDDDLFGEHVTGRRWWFGVAPSGED